MKIKEIVGKRIKVFTKSGYTHNGKVNSVEDGFINLFDEVKKKPVSINITHVSEYEILDN